MMTPGLFEYLSEKIPLENQLECLVALCRTVLEFELGTIFQLNIYVTT